MNSILKLRTDDFELGQGKSGRILTNGIKGLALIMFYSPRCTICENLLPMFKHLPQMISGCKFCTLNINENQGIITLSKQTISPITAVPMILFYVNGKPLLSYDDDPTLEKLSAFVQYALKLVESKRSFIDRGVKVESEIPKYSIARPYQDFSVKCEGDVCYLTQAEAYGRPKPNGPEGGAGQFQQAPTQHFQRQG